MEHWRECVEVFLEGLVIGLGLSIFVATAVLTVDRFYKEKEYAQLESLYQEEIERQRLELEGL